MYDRIEGGFYGMYYRIEVSNDNGTEVWSISYFHTSPRSMKYFRIESNKQSEKSNRSALLSEWTSLSRVLLFATPWTIYFMEFSRLEYWTG